MSDHQNTAPLPIYHQMASLPNSTEHRRSSCDDPAMGAEATAPTKHCGCGPREICPSCSLGVSSRATVHAAKDEVSTVRTTVSLRLADAGGWQCCACGSDMMYADGPKNHRRRLRCSNDECENYAVLVWEPIFQAGRA